jgi:outer membrane protein
MRKKIISVMFMVAALALVCQPVFAAGMKGKFGLGARFASVDSINHTSNSGTINSNIEPNTFSQYTVTGTYYILDYLAVELEAGYGETKISTSNANGLGTEYGWLKQFPILMSVRYMIPTGTNWSPYIGAGGGYYVNDFTIDRTYQTANATPDVNVNNSYSYHANVGVECFVTRNSSVNLDVKYTWNRVDFENASGTIRSEEVDLDGLSIGAGFKVFF